MDCCAGRSRKGRWPWASPAAPAAGGCGSTLSSAQQPVELNVLGAKSGCHLTGAYLATVKPALAGNGRRGPEGMAEPELLIRLWELRGIRPGRLGPEARPAALPRAAAEGLAGLAAWIGTAAAAKCSRKEAPRPQPSRPQPCSNRSSGGLAAALSPPAGLLNWNVDASEQFQRPEAVDDVRLAMRINQCLVTIATALHHFNAPAANTPLKGGVSADSEN